MRANLQSDLQSYQKQILKFTSYIYRAYRAKIGISDNFDAKEFEYPDEGPITSEENIKILDSILDQKTYLLIRTDDTMCTLGLWMLFGIPELVIDITHISQKQTTDDTDDLDNIDNLNDSANVKQESIISDEEFESKIRPIVDKYVLQSKLIYPQIAQSGNSYRMIRTYDQQNITLDFESIALHLKIVPEDEYISLNSHYLIWFYTYYMSADNDRKVIVSEEDSKVIDEHDGLEYQLYPIYNTTIEYASLKELSIPINVTDLVNRYIDHDLNDFSSDSLDDVDTIDSEEE